MWRDWFVFSRQDQRAIILLSVLIVLALSLRLTRPLWHRPDTEPALPPDSIAALLSAPAAAPPIVKVELRAFDPNTADSLELLSVGLPPHVARNILRYRRAGGKFRRPDDLARIYGMPDTLFARVKPYITLPPAPPTVQPRPQQRPAVSGPAPTAPDTLRRPHPYAEYMQAKLKPGEVVDLNQADTTELMRIPGVGPVYARMIVDYRQRLGGYHSVSQLRELEVLPSDVEQWVQVAQSPVPALRVNALTVTQLRTHPYLTFYQARAIVDYRKREGPIRSARQLLFLDEFTEADISRLEPYLSFE